MSYVRNTTTSLGISSVSKPAVVTTALAPAPAPLPVVSQPVVTQLSRSAPLPTVSKEAVIASSANIAATAVSRPTTVVMQPSATQQMTVQRPPTVYMPSGNTTTPVSAPTYQAPIQQSYAEQPYVEPSYQSYAEPQYAPAEMIPASSPEKEPLVQSGSGGLAPAALVVSKPSWWDRLLSFLGFGRKAESKMSGESMTSAASQLVRRSRDGDQNAMALIALVRQNAANGNVQAKLAAGVIGKYIQANPVPGTSTMGADVMNPKDPTYAHAVQLSLGPPLSNPRIENLLSEFGREERRAFLYGMKNGKLIKKAPSNIRDANVLGKAIGDARRLQLVRQPGSSIMQFNSAIGWELE